MLLNVTVRPKPYQLVGYHKLIEQHYCVVGDEQGLGKSLQSLMVVEATGSTALIMVPSYLKYNWRSEINKLFFDPPTVKILESEKDFLEYPKTQIVLMHYEQLKWAEKLFDWADIVIADECHYLKNIKAYRTLAVHNYIENYEPERFIGLSGTPIDNNVPEFYSQIKLCGYNPKGTSGRVYGGSFWDFQKQFSNHTQFEMMGRRINKFEGLRNVPELKSLLKGKYFRRLAKNHLDLKEMIFLDVDIKTKMTKDEEKELWDEFNAEKGKDSTIKKKSAVLTAPVTADYCNGLIGQGEKPLLIYSAHREPVEIISKKLKGRIQKVNGSTPIPLRQKYVDQFQAGQLDAIVATVSSFSTGWNLVASNHVVFNDESWIPRDNMQGRKRIDRIGQTKQTYCHRMFGSKMSKYITKKLEKKESEISKIIGG